MGSVSTSKLFSDPDLNGNVPLRVQPEVGEWGPLEVTSARTKSRRRALMPLAFLTVVCAVVALGRHMFLELQTGPMSPPAEIIVNIGMWVLPILFVLSLTATILVWILGDPFHRKG